MSTGCRRDSKKEDRTRSCAKGTGKKMAAQQAAAKNLASMVNTTESIFYQDLKITMHWCHLISKLYILCVCIIAVAQPLTPEELQDVLQEDRARKTAHKRAARTKQHRMPVVQAAGPQLPWPWQRHSQYVKDDQREQTSPVPVDIDDWMTDVFQACAQHDVAATYERLMGHTYHGSLATQLLASFELLDMPTAIDKLEVYLTLQEAILLWQDSHGAPIMPSQTAQPRDATLDTIAMLRIPANNPVPQDMPINMRRRLLTDQIWLESTVYWQIRQQLYRERCKDYTPTPVVHLPIVQNPIFVYIFSGRRRVGDYQSQLESLLDQAGQTAHILMLDLALSPRHDVGNATLLTQIKSWIAAGAVGGVLIAPPCETWSEARYLQTESSHDPRPLRSAMDPFGVAQLTIKEMQQVEISSFLLFVTLRILLIAAIYGVVSIVEHPKEPKLRSRASIWRLPWLQMMEKLGYMKRYEIWQAEFGGLSAKPTHLGVFHAPDFQEIMNRHRSMPDWSSLIQLGGRDSQGAWKTASAKEYPPTLNRVLADVHLTSWLRRTGSSSSQAQLPTQIHDEFSQLYAGNVALEEQVMQPDFHRRSTDLYSVDWSDTSLKVS